MPTEVMSADEFLAMQARGKGRRNKYNVADRVKREWRGRVYASKVEMAYAQQLDLQRIAGDIIEFVEQPIVHLGDDTTYRPDFLVIAPDTDDPYCVDIKGVETRDFIRIKKLWAKYARLELRIVKHERGGFETVEIVKGRGYSGEHT